MVELIDFLPKIYDLFLLQLVRKGISKLRTTLISFFYLRTSECWGALQSGQAFGARYIFENMLRNLK